MRKIVGIGETVLDLVFKNGQPVAAVPGGSTFNALVSLGRTAARKYKGVQAVNEVKETNEVKAVDEVKVLMVTEMGDDQVGGIMKEFMVRNALSTEGLILREGHQSALSMAFLDENNDAHYEFYRDAQPCESTLVEAYEGREKEACERSGRIRFEKDDIVLFGSFFAVEKGKRELVRLILEDARKAGAIVYYDINFRKKHKGTLEEIRSAVEENMSLCDFVRGSIEDIGNLYFPGVNPREINTKEVYREIISKFCRNFICTKGPNPVDLFSGDIHETVSVQRLTPVSTIGAGDNFNAGFVYGLIANGVTKEMAGKMSSELWREAAKYAKQFSAAVCCSMENYVSEDFLSQLE